MLLRFGIDLTTKKDYQDLYLKCSLKYNILRPSHSLRAPALSWDAMLIKTLSLNLFQILICICCSLRKVLGVELLTFLKIFEFCYSQSKHKYLKSYDPKQESKHIIYLDANNLHGNAKFLPTDRFKWIDPKESDLNKYTKNRLKACV